MTNNMKVFLLMLVLGALMGILVGIGSLIFGYGEGVSVLLCGIGAVGLLTCYYKIWHVG